MLFKNREKNSKVKGAFTIMEIAIALIIGAVIYTLFASKFGGALKVTNIKESVKTEIRAIMESCEKYKNEKAGSDGTYAGLSADSLISYLPSNMAVVSAVVGQQATPGYILGFQGGCKYQLFSSPALYDAEGTILTAPIPSGRYKMLVDCTTLANQNGWSKREIQTFHTAVIETINKGSNYMAVHYPSTATADLGADNTMLLSIATALSVWTNSNGIAVGKSFSYSVHDRVLGTATSTNLAPYTFDAANYVGRNWIMTDQIVGQ